MTEAHLESLTCQNNDGNTIIHLICQDKFLPLMKEIFALTAANFHIANAQVSIMLYDKCQPNAGTLPRYVDICRKGSKRKQFHTFPM